MKVAYSVLRLPVELMAKIMYVFPVSFILQTLNGCSNEPDMDDINNETSIHSLSVSLYVSHSERLCWLRWACPLKKMEERWACSLLKE